MRINPFLRATALSLIVAFSVQELAHAGTLSPLPKEPSSVQISHYNIPDSFGNIRNIYEAKGQRKSPVLIHIQDAHANTSAQLNISKTLEHLIREKGIRTVFIEGGTQDDSLSFLRPSADRATRERVAKQFLMRGELNGAEYLSLSSDVDMRLLGVEDKGLYDESLRLYADMVRRRGDILSYIHELDERVRTLKSALYPKHMLEFDEFLAAYERKEKDFTEYHSLLETLAASAGIHTPYYPNFESLKNLKTLEDKIDFKKANEEQAALMALLSGENFAEWSEKLEKIRSQNYSAYPFYVELFAKAAEKNISLANYPNLERYAAYLKAYSTVDFESLVSETEMLEDAVYRKSLAAADAYYLYEISRFLGLLKKLFRFQITSDEFNRYRTYRRDAQFETIAILAFLNRAFFDRAKDDEILDYVPVIEDYEGKAARFYLNNEKRDEAFIEKALVTMRKDGLDSAVLVTGGYHTENLSRLMRRSGVSHAVVTPRLSHETNVERYEDVLFSDLGEENPLKTGTLTSSTGVTGDTIMARPVVERANGGSLSVLQNALGTQAGRPQIYADEQQLAVAGARLDKSNWVQTHTPELSDYTVVFRQFEAGLPEHVLAKIKDKHGKHVSRFVAQTTLTGGLGALMPDQFDGAQLEGINGLGINIIYDNIKAQHLIEGLPDEVKNGQRNLGDYLREALYKRDDLEFTMPPLRIGGDFKKYAKGRPQSIVDREIHVQVYETESEFGKMPNYYIDAYFIDEEGKKISIFDEVYPDSNEVEGFLWRDIHMSVYSWASQILVQKLQAVGQVKKDLIFIGNEVFASLPTPMFPDAIRHDVNHTVFRPGLYQPNALSYEMMGYAPYEKPYLVKDGRVNVIDGSANAASVLTGVGVYEHTPVLEDDIFSAHLDKVESYNEDDIRNTNGVLFERWQSPHRQKLVSSFKTRLGLDPEAGIRELTDALSLPANSELLEEFKEKNDFMKAYEVYEFLVWLAEEQGNSRWLDEVNANVREVTGQPLPALELFKESLYAAMVAGPETWNSFSKNFADIRESLLARPIVSNVRRQVDYKGPDKWISLLNHLKHNPDDLKNFKENSARIVIGGRIFSWEAKHMFSQIKGLIKELGLENVILPIENYNIDEAPVMFRAMAGTVMLSDEFLEASATSMMKGMTNSAVIIGVWGGAMPELFTIVEDATGREINVFNEDGKVVSHDQLVRNLASGKWRITNGFLVRYNELRYEKSRQNPNARRPLTLDLMQATVGLGKSYKKAESRRDLQWDVLRSAYKVDIRKSQMHAYAYLWHRAIQRRKEREAFFAQMDALSSDDVIAVLERHQTSDSPALRTSFSWNRMPYLGDPARIETVYSNGAGFLGFVEGIRTIRSRGQHGKWSVSYHANNGGKAGDIFAYLEALFAQSGETLAPFRQRLSELAKQASNARTNKEKIILNFRALELADRMSLQLSWELFRAYLTENDATRKARIARWIAHPAVRENLVRYLDRHAQELSSDSENVKNYSVTHDAETHLVSVNLKEFPQTAARGIETPVRILPKSMSTLAGADWASDRSRQYAAVNVLHPEQTTRYSTDEIAKRGLPFNLSSDTHIAVLKISPTRPSELETDLMRAVEDEVAGDDAIPQEKIRQAISRVSNNPSRRLAILAPIASLSKREAEKAFGVNGIPAIMGFVAILAPSLLEKMKDWNSDVYVKLRGIVGEEIFKTGTVTFHSTSQRSAIFFSRTLKDQTVYFAFHFGVHGTLPHDGKAWFKVTSAPEQLLPGIQADRSYQVFDYLSGEAYSNSHTLASLKKGWDIGVPTDPSKNNPAWRFQIMAFRPVVGARLASEAPTDYEVEMGVKYWNGELGTTPITRPFRASRKEDVTMITDLTPEEALRLEKLANESIARGEGVFSMLVAGASSRMNTHEAPADVEHLVAGKELNSKAAVPIGVTDDGAVTTYLGEYGLNLSRFLGSIDAEARKSGIASHVWNNDVLLLSNDQYRSEHDSLLSENGNYGLRDGQIDFFHQPLGPKFIGTPADVEKQRTKFETPEDYEAALAYSQEAERKLKAGDKTAVMLPGERDPWGHGEYLHQLVASGKLLDIIDKGRKWIAVKNVDNYSSKFDKIFSRILGMFLSQGLDLQPEVSPRSPGQKGGSLIVMMDNNAHQLAEDPNINASNQGVKPTDSFWFNNAVAIMSPRYVISLYKKDGQSDEEFIAELRAADVAGRQLIADRGRQKFPKIFDAKPAKKTKAVAIKPETNMWQSSGVVPSYIKIRAIGVNGVRNLPIESYLRGVSAEEKERQLAAMRFLSTKSWSKSEDEIAKTRKEMEVAMGRAVTDNELMVTLETYEGNKILAADVLRYNRNAELVTPGIFGARLAVESPDGLLDKSTFQRLLNEPLAKAGGKTLASVETQSDKSVTSVSHPWRFGADTAYPTEFSVSITYAGKQIQAGFSDAGHLDYAPQYHTVDPQKRDDEFRPVLTAFANLFISRLGHLYDWDGRVEYRGDNVAGNWTVNFVRKDPTAIGERLAMRDDLEKKRADLLTLADLVHYIDAANIVEAQEVPMAELNAQPVGIYLRRYSVIGRNQLWQVDVYDTDSDAIRNIHVTRFRISAEEEEKLDEKTFAPSQHGILDLRSVQDAINKRATEKNNTRPSLLKVTPVAFERVNLDGTTDDLSDGDAPEDTLMNSTVTGLRELNMQLAIVERAIKEEESRFSIWDLIDNRYTAPYLLAFYKYVVAPIFVMPFVAIFYVLRAAVHAAQANPVGTMLVGIASASFLMHSIFYFFPNLAPGWASYTSFMAILGSHIAIFSAVGVAVYIAYHLIVPDESPMRDGIALAAKSTWNFSWSLIDNRLTAPPLLAFADHVLYPVLIGLPKLLFYDLPWKFPATFLVGYTAILSLATHLAADSAPFFDLLGAHTVIFSGVGLLTALAYWLLVPENSLLWRMFVAVGQFLMWVYGRIIEPAGVFFYDRLFAPLFYRPIQFVTYDFWRKAPELFVVVYGGFVSLSLDLFMYSRSNLASNVTPEDMVAANTLIFGSLGVIVLTLYAVNGVRDWMERRRIANSGNFEPARVQGLAQPLQRTNTERLVKHTAESLMPPAVSAIETTAQPLAIAVENTPPVESALTAENTPEPFYKSESFIVFGAFVTGILIGTYFVASPPVFLMAVFLAFSATAAFVLVHHFLNPHEFKPLQPTPFPDSTSSGGTPAPAGARLSTIRMRAPLETQLAYWKDKSKPTLLRQIRRVLIVDDETSLVNALQRRVSRILPGVEIVTAMNSRDALRAVQDSPVERPFDLILTDNNLREDNEDAGFLFVQNVRDIEASLAREGVDESAVVAVVSGVFSRMDAFLPDPETLGANTFGIEKGGRMVDGIDLLLFTLTGRSIETVVAQAPAPAELDEVKSTGIRTGSRMSLLEKPEAQLTPDNVAEAQSLGARLIAARGIKHFLTGRIYPLLATGILLVNIAALPDASAAEISISLAGSKAPASKTLLDPAQVRADIVRERIEKTKAALTAAPVIVSAAETESAAQPEPITDVIGALMLSNPGLVDSIPTWNNGFAKNAWNRMAGLFGKSAVGTPPAEHYAITIPYETLFDRSGHLQSAVDMKETLKALHAVMKTHPVQFTVLFTNQNAPLDNVAEARVREMLEAWTDTEAAQGRALTLEFLQVRAEETLVGSMRRHVDTENMKNLAKVVVGVNIGAEPAKIGSKDLLQNTSLDNKVEFYGVETPSTPATQAVSAAAIVFTAMKTVLPQLNVPAQLGVALRKEKTPFGDIYVVHPINLDREILQALVSMQSTASAA